MADEPDTEVTIRNPHTGEQRPVFRGAVPFFPDWEVVTDDDESDQPKRNAAADAWRDYVVLHGFANEETAADLTRDELIALVPEEN